MADEVKIYQGDCLVVLPTLEAESVDAVVTSPPYWNLRDYGVEGQIGLEDTPQGYVEALTQVFDEVWRVLKSGGTLWLNLGDTYANDAKWGGASGGKNLLHKQGLYNTKHDYSAGASGGYPATRNRKVTNLSSKNLIGIPWRVAFALQDRGWVLRKDIIWHKTNAMPESVTDRPSTAHEYIFLFSKTEHYYYNAEAIKESASGTAHSRGQGAGPKQTGAPEGVRANSRFQTPILVEMRNKRDVWSIPSQPYKGAHFATFPEKLVEPCILAGCPVGGVVLDPFGGSGTVGRVAQKHGRNAVLIELNPAYIEQIEQRNHLLQVEVEDGQSVPATKTEYGYQLRLA